MLRTLLLALAVAIALPLAGPAVAPGAGTTAQAAELKFMIRSRAPYTLHLEFYSQDRTHFWPGKPKIYVLKKSRSQRYTLNCRRGEKICYGAWKHNDQRYYWGVGRGNTKGCVDCCFTCGSKKRKRVILNDIWGHSAVSPKLITYAE